MMSIEEMHAELTETQVSIAQRLAAGYYHEWAKLDLSLVPRPLTAVRIRETAASVGLDPMGKLGPRVEEFDGRAYVVHETTSGRTRWAIAPNGDVEVTIARPHGWAIYALLEYDAENDTHSCVSFSQSAPEEVLTLWRHKVAFQDFLDALGVAHTDDMTVRVDVDTDEFYKFVQACKARDGVEEPTLDHVRTYAHEAARHAYVLDTSADAVAEYFFETGTF